MMVDQSYITFFNIILWHPTRQILIFGHNGCQWANRLCSWSPKVLIFIIFWWWWQWWRLRSGSVKIILSVVDPIEVVMTAKDGNKGLQCALELYVLFTCDVRMCI